MNETVSRQELSDRCTDHNRLGVDAKGRDHYYDAHLSTAWVVVDDEIAHVAAGISLTTWHDHVAERTGWNSHCHDDRTIAQLLVDTIQGAA